MSVDAGELGRTSDDHFPAIDLVNTSEGVDESGLAGAIGTDDGSDLASFEGNVEIVHSKYAVEVLDEIFGGEEGHVI